MRFALSVIPVLVVSLCLWAAGAVASESGEFIEWALEQGKACDSSWNTFVRSQPDGVVVTGTTKLRGMTTRSSARTASGLYTNGKGFIHKASLPFLPFSTRGRNGPARGLTKLESPASARLNVPHTRKRPFNSRTELGSSLRRRTGATRLGVISSHRISRVSRRRGVASSSFTHTSRRR
jgi:hypothetical protein